MSQRAQTILCMVAGLCCVFLFSYRIGFPPEKYYDEVYQVTTAQQFLGLSGYTETAHPPFGEVLMVIALYIFGDHSWSWRLIALVSGISCISILFLIAKHLTHKFWIAFLAAAIFALDGITITMSRIGMLNMPMLLWMLLAVLALVACAGKLQASRKKSFLVAGIFFGFALATRWPAAGILGVLAILFLFRLLDDDDRGAFVLDFVSFFCVGTLVAYAAAYTIFIFLPGYGWSGIIPHQLRMMSYHKLLSEGHTYGSEWWGWPFLVRPIWFFFERSHGSVNGVLCIGNPAIFWMIPVAIGYTIWRFIKERGMLNLVILFGFFGQWLPWAFVQRVKFFHYFQTTMPFVALALAVLLVRLWEKGKLGRGLVALYLIVVVGMFAYWYPLHTGLTISESFFREHMWFRSWI